MSRFQKHRWEWEESIIGVTFVLACVIFVAEFQYIPAWWNALVHTGITGCDPTVLFLSVIHTALSWMWCQFWFGEQGGDQ